MCTVQDEDSEFDFLNVMRMCQQYHQETQLPHHIELDQLFIQFKKTVQKIYIIFAFCLQILLLSGEPSI